MKLCKKCKKYKPETLEFFPFKKKTQKFESPCRECNKKTQKKWKKKNKKKVLSNAKIYRDKNKDTINKKRREAYPKYKSVKYAYNNKNKKKLAKKRNKNRRKRYKNDPAFKFRYLFSTIINQAFKDFKSNKNNQSINQYLEYTIEEFIAHIISLFSHPDNLAPDGSVWMTLKNHGVYNSKTWDDNDPRTWTWQTDHIVPQSELPYDSMEHPNFKKCWALENLRPLNAKINIIEGATLIRHKNKEK